MDYKRSTSLRHCSNKYELAWEGEKDKLFFIFRMKSSRAVRYDYIQWGKKVFSQPPIVQVLPLKKMREACNFHHRYTSTMRDKIRKTFKKITL